jgi:hypothetical protein
MSVLEAAEALSKDIIDLIKRHQSNNSDTATRAVMVALADVTAFVIKQWYKPEHRDEAVEWHASLVKDHIRDPLWHQKSGDQLEEND